MGGNEEETDPRDVGGRMRLVRWETGGGVWGEQKKFRNPPRFLPWKTLYISESLTRKRLQEGGKFESNRRKIVGSIWYLIGSSYPVYIHMEVSPVMK